MGNKHLTIFAFSAKNWKCAQSEVSGLICLFKGHIMYEIQSLINNKVWVRFIGDRVKLDDIPIDLMDEL